MYMVTINSNNLIFPGASKQRITTVLFLRNYINYHLPLRSHRIYLIIVTSYVSSLRHDHDTSQKLNTVNIFLCNFHRQILVIFRSQFSILGSEHYYYLFNSYLTVGGLSICILRRVKNCFLIHVNHEPLYMSIIIPYFDLQFSPKVSGNPYTQPPDQKGESLN